MYSVYGMYIRMYNNIYIQYVCMNLYVFTYVHTYMHAYAWLHGCVFFLAYFRLLLQKARGSAPTARVMMKSAKLEWQLSNVPKAIELLETAIESHPEFPKVS